MTDRMMPSRDQLLYAVEHLCDIGLLTDLFLWIDSDEVVFAVQAGGESDFAENPMSWVGSKLADLPEADFGKLLALNLRRARDSGTRTSFLYTSEGPGLDFEAETAVVPVSDSLCVARVRLAEFSTMARELLRERKEMPTIIGAPPDGIIELDVDWRILFFNDNAVQILQAERHELLGANLFELLRMARCVGSHFLDIEAREITYVVEAGQTYAVDYASIGREGAERVFVSCRVAPHEYAPGQKGALFTFRDLSEERRVRLELEKALVDAEAATQSSQLMNEFLANISHEMRTPMHGILSFASFGRDKIRQVSPEKLLSYFEKIDVCGKRLLRLVDDLLDMSKLSADRMSLKRENVDFREVVEEIGSELSSLLEDNGIRFAVSAEGLTAACIDVQRMSQVLGNLIGNSIKFSDRGTLIEVRLRGTYDTLHIEVSDEGIGIPSGETETIFDKFSQSSRTTKGAGGTGLGLAICRDFIDLHGGRIWAENHMGRGVSIHIEIPRIFELEASAKK